MKRFLLTMSVALFATTMFAQESVVADNSVATSTSQVLEPASAVTPTLNEPTTSDFKKSSKRNKASGFYYTKPIGSLYDNYFTEGQGAYLAARVIVPAFKDITYNNMATSPSACNWTFHRSSSGDRDMSSYTDANYNLTFSAYPQASGYVMFGSGPILNKGSEQYTLGYYATTAYNGSYYDPYVYSYNEVSMLSFLEPHYTANLGSLSTGYLMGTGNYTGSMYYYDENGTRQSKNGTYVCSYIYQDYPAPISPLYAENIYLEGLYSDKNQDDDEPIKNNAVLTMEIYDLETGELLETLTATTGCFTHWQYMYDQYYNYYNAGLIKFSKWEEDLAFGTVEAPIVIDRATRIYVRGFEDQTNINFGTNLNPVNEYDGEEELASAAMCFIDPTGEITPTSALSYSPTDSETGDKIPLSLNLRFNGLLDNAIVYETINWVSASTGERTATVSGYNVLRISDDGKTCTAEIDNDNPNYLQWEGLYVETACPWYDDSSNENYYFSDLPEWITGVKTDSYYDVDESYFDSYPTFTATAISSGEGRGAIVYLNGRGYTSPVPVYLLQGNITKDDIVPDGISTVANTNETKTTLTGTYNLAGQRVSESTKGIVITDGKKFIAK